MALTEERARAKAAYEFGGCPVSAGRSCRPTILSVELGAGKTTSRRGDTQDRRRVRLRVLTRRALLIAAATDSPASNVLRRAITSRLA
jgi:hypothetical protein